MPMSRAAAAALVRHFEDYVREDEMAGGGHPELMEWRNERYGIARERLIQHMMGNPLAAKALKMPVAPEIDYDR